MLINYKDKCGTCKFFKKRDDKVKRGECTNENSRAHAYSSFGLVMGKTKCQYYKYDGQHLCGCGTFKEIDYNYCPTCGKKIEGNGV